MKQRQELTVISTGALLTIGLTACYNFNHNNDGNSPKVTISKIIKRNDRSISNNTVLLTNKNRQKVEHSAR